MKLTKGKKIFLIIAILAFVVLLLNSSTTFAAINTSYAGYDAVPDTALDEAFSDATLLELLAKLVYALGRFFEWILGIIFKLLTGSSDFPWADKIVFNAVPLLDVNFINPSDGSFVGQFAIQSVLKNLYATIMTLAISFFGVVVLITAIKLVISTIASEKAKYKQAIVDWLVGLVLLFCMHFFISFIFYLNEQLVVVASNIVTTQLKGADKVATTGVDKLGSELIADMKKKGFDNAAKTLENNAAVLTTFMNLTSEDKSKGIHEFLMKGVEWYTFGADVAKNTNEQYSAVADIIAWAISDNITVKELVEIRDQRLYYYIDTPFENMYNNKEAQAISEEDLDKIFGNYVTTIKFYGGVNANKRMVTRYKDTPESTNYSLLSDQDGGQYAYYLSDGGSILGARTNGGDRAEASAVTTTYYWTNVLDDLIVLKSASGSGSSGGANGSRLISDLATYFRYNAYNKELRTTNRAGLKNGDEIRIQNMIMYAILVVQSLILFISYVKRLFYVILLAMMAPIVVVFDFFQKFGK